MGYFSLIAVVDSPGITVNAFQIASLRDIPYDNGFLVLGKLEQMGREFAGLSPVAKGI
jgi:hypothetical protein